MYDRQEHEKYYTPSWAITALRDAEGAYLHSAKTVYDPAAGDGAIMNCFTRSFGSDISPDRADILQSDYLTQLPPAKRYAAIVTNPPYGRDGGLAVKFIEKSLQEAEYVAMLLTVDFDSGSTRRHLFADCNRFAVKYVLTKRLRWTNLEQKSATPRKNHAWFVWRNIERRGQELAYLP